MQPSSGDDYFDSQITARDRAFFELGIKLGALYHQFVGSPIQKEPRALRKLAEGIKASIESQPFVKEVQVEIKPSQSESSQSESSQSESSQSELNQAQSTSSEILDPFNYTSLSGQNLIAKISLQYKEWKLVGEMKWIEALQYPLMFVSHISHI